MLKVAVIGSSFSAYSCVLTLNSILGSGNSLQIAIDVIDYGLSEEQQPESTNFTPPGPAGKNTSKTFSSFYIPPDFQVTSSIEGGIAGSAAFGGWSNVWGATVSQYTKWGLSHWRTKSSKMTLAYKFLEENIPQFKLTASDDEEWNSNKSDSQRVIPEIFAHKIVKFINDRKYTMSASNLAVNSFSHSQDLGCNQCGKCLSGCPSDHIWSTRAAFKDLFEKYSTNYVGSIWVESVRESNDKVFVCGKDINGQSFEKDYNLVFLGLGALQTAPLLLRSKVARDPVVLRDSAMFIQPFSTRRFKKIDTALNRISLSDAFISSTSIHSENATPDFFAQLYGITQNLLDLIYKESLILRIIPKVLLRQIINRFGIAMCFFDQSVSGKIIISAGNKNQTNIKAIECRSKTRGRKNFARQELKKLGLLAVPFFGRHMSPGVGYHFGASFPEHLNGKTMANYTDSIGRPNGLKYTHIVDSSALPHISAMPITVTIMANASCVTQEAIKHYLLNNND
jgi:hypothetical protein